MILNFDQTPLKYAPVANRTSSQKGSKHVAVRRTSYKQAITATFGITYTNMFLPMQLVYGGKPKQSYPLLSFLIRSH